MYGETFYGRHTATPAAVKSNKNQKWDPLRAMKTLIGKKLGHTTKSFLFCSVYRPPSSKSEWIDTFCLQIENLLILNNEIYIVGDLNIDFKDGNAANNKWKHVIETHNFLSNKSNGPLRNNNWPCIRVWFGTYDWYIRSIFPFSIALSTNSIMIVFLMTSPNRWIPL